MRFSTTEYSVFSTSEPLRAFPVHFGMKAN